jgi:hypothetical protein
MWPEGAQVELQRGQCVPKVIKLSSEVSECKPLAVGVIHLKFSKNAVLAMNELMKMAFSIAMVVGLAA